VKRGSEGGNKTDQATENRREEEEKKTGGAAGENPTLARSQTETETAAHLREQRKPRRKPEQRSRHSGGGSTEPSARGGAPAGENGSENRKKNRVPGGASSGRADWKAETLTDARQANVRRRRKENPETSAHGRDRAGERVPGGGGAGAGAENPSSGLVKKEYGPGRIHGRRQKNEIAADESCSTGSKGLPRAEINTKNHTKKRRFQIQTRTPRTSQI
jgi:hypothetical protein